MLKGKEVVLLSYCLRSLMMLPFPHQILSSNSVVLRRSSREYIGAAPPGFFKYNKYDSDLNKSI